MLVARAIIDAAKRGERDPIRLCEAAIEALSGQGALNKYASPDRRFKPGQSRRLSSLRRVSVSPRSSE